MKECDKWLKSPDTKFWLEDYGPFSAAKAGYREALKRVLKECKYNGDGDYIAFISLWIKEELEDEAVK